MHRYVRGCIDCLGGGPSRIVKEPSAERGKHVVVPDTHPFPAPVARPPSPGCGPWTARINRDLPKIYEWNLHSRLWLLLGDIRRVCRRLLALLRFVLLIGPTTLNSTTPPLRSPCPILYGFSQSSPSALVDLLLYLYDSGFGQFEKKRTNRRTLSKRYAVSFAPQSS